MLCTISAHFPKQIKETMCLGIHLYLNNLAKRLSRMTGLLYRDETYSLCGYMDRVECVLKI